jgi:phosphatidylserine/phosphatidylglycerophosphate/cardiolipin synthase-like enzyme
MKPASVRVVVSGSAWMGGSLGSVESALYRMFEQANDEVIFVVYSISGASEMLFKQLVAMLQRGIRIRMIINRFADQHISVQRQLRQLHQAHPHLMQLLSFTPPQEQADLHAKVIVVDRQWALVGSANLSLRGLMNNHELGVVVEGSVAAEIGRAIDVLMASPYATPVQ